MIVTGGLGAEEVGLCIENLSEKAVMQAERTFLVGTCGAGQGS